MGTAVERVLENPTLEGRNGFREHPYGEPTPCPVADDVALGTAGRGRGGYQRLSDSRTPATILGQASF